MPIKVPLNNSSKINLPIILIFYNIPVLDIHLIVYLIMYTIIYLIYLIIDLTMCSIIYLIYLILSLNVFDNIFDKFDNIR